ncbi:MAG: ABC transporter permease [Kiloniellaceae bacterium]
MREPAAMAPDARRHGAVNWRGLWNLFRRGMHRFFRYAAETLGGPAVSSLLFLAIFVLALGGTGEVVPGVPLATFVAPGIVMFSMTHSAFENAAAPILYDKLEGMIGDIVSAPLSPLEIVAGYALSATASALVTGTLIVGLMSLFVELSVHSVAAVLGFALGGALLFALAGTVIGIWADRWDHYSAAETFLILPLGLLSGAFFTLERLPADARWAFEVNPVFHAVDGFRFGFTGHADGMILAGAGVLAVLNLALMLIAWRLFAIGYKIKP